MASGSGSGPGPVSFLLGCAGIILVLSLFVPIGIWMQDQAQRADLAAKAAIEASALKYTIPDAHLSGTFKTTDPGSTDASGTPYPVRVILDTDGTATFNVLAPQAGIYNLIVDGDLAQTVDVSVNNNAKFSMRVGHNLTGDTSWEVPIHLNSGSNTIVLSNQSSQGGYSLDWCYHSVFNCSWITGISLYPVSNTQ